MEALTANNLYMALLVVLAICGAISTVGKAIDTLNKWQKPSKDAHASYEETLQRHTRRLEIGEDRMTKIEAELEDFHAGQYHTCMCLKALLGHELHNGNTQEMIDAAGNLDKWLAKRL